MASISGKMIVSAMEVDQPVMVVDGLNQRSVEIQAELNEQEKKEEEGRNQERKEEEAVWDVASKPGVITPVEEIYNKILEQNPSIRDGLYPQRLLYTGDKLMRALHFCREDCEYGGVHPRFAIWSLENQPMQFHSHKRGEVAFYTPVRKGEIRKPFRIPASGDTLMSGIKWATTRPKEDKAGLVNSCGLDGFLTDLKLRALDIETCFECLFRHEGTSGRNLENILRTLISHIFVFARSEADQRFQQIRKFTKEQDLFLKRVWLDDQGFRIMKRSFVNSAGVEFEAEDLLYVSKEGEDGFDEDGFKSFKFGNTRVSMQYLLMEQLHQVCQLRVYFHCSCTTLRKGDAKIQVFGEGVQPLIHPAYATFSTQKMKFDEDFAATEKIRMGLSGDMRVNDAPLAKRIDMCECPICGDNLVVDKVMVPKETWMLIVEIPREQHNEPRSLNTFRKRYYLQDREGNRVRFDLAWISAVEDMTTVDAYGQKAGHMHFTSYHYYQKGWYYYDDLDREGKLEKVTASIHRSMYSVLQRAFYIRYTNPKHHECIQSLDDSKAVMNSIGLNVRGLNWAGLQRRIRKKEICWTGASIKAKNLM